ERPRTARHFEAFRREDIERVAIEDAATAIEHLQHMPCERADGRSSTEEPRMTRRPPKRPAVLVVDFADEQATTPCIEFRRRRPPAPEQRRPELQLFTDADGGPQQVERIGEGPAAPEDPRQQDESEVRV